MDTSTALIVFIFFISIMTSLGGKGYTPPPSPPTEIIYKQVAVGEPDPSFIAGGGDAALSSIKNYIAKYRNDFESTTISESIVKHSKTYDMNPKLVAALIARESKFNPRAISSSGAAGLGQLIPSTAKGLNIDDPYDIDQNAKGTTRYFKSLITRFNGKVSSAIAGYLEGPNAVSKQGGFSSHTKSYVEDILNIYQKI
jgi:soluble lytic murein transglycosylase-like protein